MTRDDAGALPAAFDDIDTPSATFDDADVPTDAHETALACLAAGIRAAHPERVVADSTSLEDDRLRIRDRDGAQEYDLAAYDRILVLGGGKAAAGVAAGLETRLGDRIDGGVVVATGGGGGVERVRVREGDHPTPSERNVEATRELLAWADEADADTLVLAAITGGASALLSAPVDGIPLSALGETTDALLASGATIDEVNAVRKHCSAIKGGRLARRCAPATVVTLALSDVVGDDPSVIGSGPTVPDDSTYADALAVLDRYDLRAAIPGAVVDHLERGTAGEREETPDELGAGDGRSTSASGRASSADGPSSYHLLASTRTAVEAARDVASERGYGTLVLSSRLRGEASEVGRVHAAVAEEVRHDGDPIEPPAVVLSGGEVTVTVRGEGTGGANQELALAAALEFADRGTDAVLASVDTDGIDGPTDAAGALVDRETVADSVAAQAALAENDVYELLDERGALLRIGYTGTNVNDLRALVVPANADD